MTILSLSDTDESRAERRKTVRDLADITIHTFSDTDLDAKIENWDEVARTYFQAQGLALDGTESFFHNLITVANLLTSVAIRQGIGNSDNLAVVKEQTMLYRSIINAQNKQEPEQMENYFGHTAGVNNGSEDFGRNRGTFS